MNHLFLKIYDVSKKLFKAASVILFYAGIQSCTEHGSLPQSKKETSKENHGMTIEITGRQMKAVGIELGLITQKNLNSIVKASGYLEVPPQNKADITVLTGGVIRDIFVLEGNSVTKGQALLTIENAEFIKLQQNYLAAKSNLKYLEQEYNRQKELQGNNAGTGKLYQQAEASYLVEKTNIAGLEKQLLQLHIHPGNLNNQNIISQITIPAPISGIVGHISVNIGTYAEPSKSLMDIVDNSKIHADLLVYEKDLFKVKQGQKVSFVLTNQNNRLIEGKIYGINQSFEGQTKAVIVHAIINSAVSKELFPGMYVSALIDVGNQTKSAVPSDAIVKEDGKEYIYILADSAHGKPEPDAQKYWFKKIEVRSGISELGYTQIIPLTDIPAQTKIVTKGSFYIRSVEKSGGKEEEE